MTVSRPKPGSWMKKGTISAQGSETLRRASSCSTLEGVRLLSIDGPSDKIVLVDVEADETSGNEALKGSGYGLTLVVVLVVVGWPVVLPHV